jgi:hypothetical protein
MDSIRSSVIRTRALRWAITAGVVAAAAIAGCAELAHRERELVFRVVPGEASWYAGLPDGVREIDIPVTDGQRIHAWWWTAERDHAPAVLYFHGSRWNLTGQLARIRQLHDFGFSVLAIDYRGFGRSDGGVPSEASVYEDARAAWRQFAELVPDARRAHYGHSQRAASPSISPQSRSRDDRRDPNRRAAHRRVVVHDTRRCRESAVVRVASRAMGDRREVRHARQDQRRQDAGAVRARRSRPADPGTLQPGAF